MKIRLCSVYVQNQDQGLRFYTEVLGFAKKHDIPMGEYRWLTVVSPEEPEGAEVVLEPLGNEASKTYQKALYEQNIPLTAFLVDDIHAEYARLTAAGVQFKNPPQEMGPVTLAMLDDTCGNWIQLFQR